MALFFPSPNTWQMMNPLDTLIPKIPFSFFAEFRVQVTSGARGSVSLGFWWARQWSPFMGGSSQRAVSTPRPPAELKARPPMLPTAHATPPRQRTTSTAHGTPSVGANRPPVWRSGAHGKKEPGKGCRRTISCWRVTKHPL